MSLPDPVRFIVADAVTHVIFLSLGVVLIALFATIMIPALPMKDRSKMAPPKDQEVIAPDAHL